MTISIVAHPEKILGQARPFETLVLPVASRFFCGKRLGSSGGKMRAMTPADAVAWIGSLLEDEGTKIRDVNICGPGDALATPEVLFCLLDLLEERHPDLNVKVTSLGFGAASLATALAARKIAEVSLQVDAVGVDFVKKIYAWIRPDKKTLPLDQSAKLLVEEQALAVKALTGAGLRTGIQTMLYSGINDRHVAEIAKKMATLGASSMTILPFEGTFGNEESDMPGCDEIMLAAAKYEAACHLAVDEHGEVVLPSSCSLSDAAICQGISKKRPNVAATSSNGMDVDLHLGKASKILIYGPREDGVLCLLDVRNAPESGTGRVRWEMLARECLFDCFALLTTRAGESPQKVLAEEGIRTLLVDDAIEGLVDVLYGGKKKKVSAGRTMNATYFDK